MVQRMADFTFHRAAFIRTEDRFQTEWTAVLLDQRQLDVRPTQLHPSFRFWLNRLFYDQFCVPAR
jgi:hypothetical protein